MQIDKDGIKRRFSHNEVVTKLDSPESLHALTALLFSACLVDLSKLLDSGGHNASNRCQRNRL